MLCADLVRYSLGMSEKQHEEKIPRYKRVAENLRVSLKTGDISIYKTIFGEIHRTSLDTINLEEAKKRRNAYIAKYQKIGENHKKGNYTVGECFEELVLRNYRVGKGGTKILQRTEIVQKTLNGYNERAKQLWTVVDFRDRSAREIDAAFLADVFRRYRVAPDVGDQNYNNTLGVVKWIFEIAIQRGVRTDNPAEHIRRVRVKEKEIKIPNREQFRQLLIEVENAGSRHSKNCADLVRFLAFGGFRLGEAAGVTWADVGPKMIFIRHGKGNKSRYVGIIPEMAALLEKLAAASPDRLPTNSVMNVRECPEALKAACKRVGIPHLTHHGLRHLFVTMCIESDVNFYVIAKWIGHTDLKLIMKIYGHLRDQHSEDSAKKVSYGTLPPAA